MGPAVRLLRHENQITTVEAIGAVAVAAKIEFIFPTHV